MKIALVQQRAGESRAQNIEAGVAAVRKAVQEGAKIVAFAELAFDRFWPQEFATEETLAMAEPIPGPTTEVFCKLAKELGVVLLPNLFELDGERRFDSSPVIDTDGSILGITRMIHITDFDFFHERGYYAPGDRGLPVYETSKGRLGVAICYDRHFPESFRALALGGAQIVFVPQAGAVDEWPEGIYEGELQVAAMQNGFFTALCNRVGPEPKVNFAGESFVCNPKGEVIARAGQGTDEILLADIDFDEIEHSPAKQMFLADRRPELYADWLAKP